MLRNDFAELISYVLLKQAAASNNSITLIWGLKKVGKMEYERGHTRTLPPRNRRILKVQSEKPTICSVQK